MHLRIAVLFPIEAIALVATIFTQICYMISTILVADDILRAPSKTETRSKAVLLNLEKY